MTVHQRFDRFVESKVEFIGDLVLIASGVKIVAEHAAA